MSDQRLTETSKPRDEQIVLSSFSTLELEDQASKNQVPLA
jgi:hypothetical protein